MGIWEIPHVRLHVIFQLVLMRIQFEAQGVFRLFLVLFQVVCFFRYFSTRPNTKGLATWTEFLCYSLDVSLAAFHSKGNIPLRAT